MKSLFTEQDLAEYEIQRAQQGLPSKTRVKPLYCWIGEEMRGARFSADRRHRYSLWRRFDQDATHEELCCFIGLNPSTADETEDDPTIRRCMGFARDWGFCGIVMLNLFSYRATDPKKMKSQTDPVGADNNDAILDLVARCGRTVCCWGAHGAYLGRGLHVRTMLKDYRLFHFGLTKSGEPRHPLYLLKKTELWEVSP